MSTNISQKINFNKLNNTRDLGGIRTSDGSIIKSGRLIRSGQLYFADEADIAVLEEIPVRTIYDFRSLEEMADKPDPILKGAEHKPMPILREMVAGISRDKKNDRKAIDIVLDGVVSDPNAAANYMIGTYKVLVSDDYALSQYAAFLDGISKAESGAVLWHCTAGKDRAGFATALILEILGVKRDDILADYLSTATHLEGEINALIDMLMKKPELRGGEKAIRELFGVKEEYLMNNFRFMEENYGSADAFLEKALGVDDRKKEKIRQLYL